MNVAFVTSVQLLRKLDISPVQVYLDWLAHVPEYVQGMMDKLKKKDRLVGIASGQMTFPTDEGIALRFTDLGRVKTKRKGVVVASREQYLKAARDERVQIIAILSETPSQHRVMVIKALVDAGEFCDSKEHWLYGVPNPAELGMYNDLFSRFVSSKITVAVCASCFSYSTYGILFSREQGVLRPIRECSDIDLSFDADRIVNYRMNREQIRYFLRNQEIVQDFARGSVAPAYADVLHASLRGQRYVEDKG